MKYDHPVKSGGRYYAAGEDVPELKYVEEKKPTEEFADAEIEFETSSIKRGRPKKNNLE